MIIPDVGMNNAKDEPSILAFLYLLRVQYFKGDDFWIPTTIHNLTRKTTQTSMQNEFNARSNFIRMCVRINILP